VRWQSPGGPSARGAVRPRQESRTSGVPQSARI
jgi:hypothetical protein